MKYYLCLIIVVTFVYNLYILNVTTFVGQVHSQSVLKAPVPIRSSKLSSDEPVQF